MAKYTELFGEWLQSNQLPTIFNEIENFSDLFTLQYIDKEIGFETEWLFEQKLKEKANILIPIYKKRLSAFDTLQDKLINQLTIKTTEANNNTYSNGSQKQRTKILPILEDNAEPSNVVESEAFNNNEVRDLTRTEDLRPNEIRETLNYINDTKNIIINQLLNAFDNFFMKIY